ncbi:MAG: imidazoleglycerol-phosphate dehydratase HisB [Veillonellaceae bacterium]|nr:imidazoleglycerol-phosphate dehydratase HisB [Veillonellaceae bacterium]
MCDKNPEAAREGFVSRQTQETRVDVSVSLDGTGDSRIATGIGFFDHMLTLFAKHGLFTLKIQATGDLAVDCHHTVEDVGIVLGQALQQAVGDKRGIRRYGQFLVPMDEALAQVILDFSGRPFLVFDAELGQGHVGELDVEMVEEFLRALAVNAGITLHVRILYGKNRHHMIEAIFKALGRALAQSLEIDPRVQGVPSSKGML